MTSIEQDYREAYNKHCNDKNKHVLLYQVSKCYHIYSFDDLNTDIETLANTLSFLIGQPETALAAMEYPADTRVLNENQDQSIDENYSSRLNLVIGSDRRITNVFCG